MTTSSERGGESHVSKSHVSKSHVSKSHVSKSPFTVLAIHPTSAAGSSSSFTTVFKNRAPSAPSITR